MKKTFAKILPLSLAALFLTACATSSTTGKNPWAPPEKKKSFAERWDEKTKKVEATEKTRVDVPATEQVAPSVAVPATQPVEISAPKSIEIAEIVFADIPKKIAVGYKIGRSEYLAMGDFFAIRGKDARLRGVARLDVVDGTTFGFSILAGTATAGDRVVIPTDEILAEISKKFPNSGAPVPAQKSAAAPEKTVSEPEKSTNEKPAIKKTAPKIDAELGEAIPDPVEE